MISSNSELGNEHVQLACQAFYALLSTQFDPQFVTDVVISFQNLDSNTLSIYFLKNWYTVADPELFKLLNANECLKVKQKDTNFTMTDTLFEITFDVIYRNCIKYTRYSYYAYKVLYVWVEKLKKTPDILFWSRNNCILERKLEAIIFSNWSNALNDICKKNAQIFKMYLEIMLQKYDNMELESVGSAIVNECLLNISWRNKIKYIILTELVQVLSCSKIITEPFLLCLCSTLTRNSLHSCGTKLYVTILKHHSHEIWTKLFGGAIRVVVELWESEAQ